MRAVVSRVQLNEPVPDAEFDMSELAGQARAIEGFVSIQIIRLDETNLVLVITGEDDAAIDRIRDEVGNAWMREHIVPRAAGPPDRQVGDVVVSI
jgi:hypothetical protein